MEENNELDLVVFKDENDNEITMEVLDYFFYEGEEFAELIEYNPDSACNGCDKEACEGCANGEEGPVEVTIMKIVPVGDDEEEFVPVDEKLGQKLIDLLNSGAFDDIDDEEE